MHAGHDNDFLLIRARNRNQDKFNWCFRRQVMRQSKYHAYAQKYFLLNSYQKPDMSNQVPGTIYLASQLSRILDLQMGETKCPLKGNPWGSSQLRKKM